MRRVFYLHLKKVKSSNKIMNDNLEVRADQVSEGESGDTEKEGDTPEAVGVSKSAARKARNREQKQKLTARREKHALDVASILAITGPKRAPKKRTRQNHKDQIKFKPVKWSHAVLIEMHKLHKRCLVDFVSASQAGEMAMPAIPAPIRQVFRWLAVKHYGMRVHTRGAGAHRHLVLYRTANTRLEDPLMLKQEDMQQALVNSAIAHLHPKVDPVKLKQDFLFDHPLENINYTLATENSILTDSNLGFRMLKEMGWEQHDDATSDESSSSDNDNNSDSEDTAHQWKFQQDRRGIGHV